EPRAGADADHRRDRGSHSSSGHSEGVVQETAAQRGRHRVRRDPGPRARAHDRRRLARRRRQGSRVRTTVRVGVVRLAWVPRAPPSETVTVDIHCVTKWSKLNTVWTGVSLDTLLDGVETSAEYVLAFSDGGYTTNLPLEDVTGGKAWVAYEFGGEPLEPEHGGPARLLVPHLYFWKSAKWVRGLDLRAEDEPGFWEGYGYHNYGDPWQEQRYAGD